MRGLALAICLISNFAPTAEAQEFRRAFHLTDFTSAGGAQEIATALRDVAGIQQVVADAANADLIVKGTESQLLLAEWLVQKLDVPLDSYTEPERRAVGSNLNDVVDIVELKNAEAYATLQEMLTTVRTVAEITKIHQVSSPRILVFRGDPAQVALGEFLVS